MSKSSSQSTSPDYNDPRWNQAVVKELDTDNWGVVVEVCVKFGHEGARVMWTHDGSISWAPFLCLEYVYTP